MALYELTVGVQQDAVGLRPWPEGAVTVVEVIGERSGELVRVDGVLLLALRPAGGG